MLEVQETQGIPEWIKKSMNKDAYTIHQQSVSLVVVGEFSPQIFSLEGSKFLCFRKNEVQKIDRPSGTLQYKLGQNIDFLCNNSGKLQITTSDLVQVEKIKQQLYVLLSTAGDKVPLSAIGINAQMYFTINNQDSNALFEEFYLPELSKHTQGYKLRYSANVDFENSDLTIGRPRRRIDIRQEMLIRCGDLISPLTFAKINNHFDIKNLSEAKYCLNLANDLWKNFFDDCIKKIKEVYE